MQLEEFSVLDFPKSSSTKLYCRACNFLWLLFNSLSLYSFSANSFGKQTPFYANGICTVSYSAHFLGPSAPDTISTIESSVFSTFEGLTRWRTNFYLSQYMHNLWLYQQNFMLSNSSLVNTFHLISYKVFSFRLRILALFLRFLRLGTLPSVNFYYESQ